MLSIAKKIADIAARKYFVLTVMKSAIYVDLKQAQHIYLTFLIMFLYP